MIDVLLSVGIDIGTSTTQVIFSNITIQNMASAFSVPRIEIVGKEIVYRSDIYFTPLKSPTEIDMAKVRDIVAGEYRRFGVDKAKIHTGGVVITGETARKQNAAEVVRTLSDFAGDFVVATAGPDLESIIAGRGAGADAYSKQHGTTAANYDVGGGTSNFAMFQNGNLVCTGCMDIGGRLVKIDASTGKIIYIAPKIKMLSAENGIQLKEGDRADADTLAKLCTRMTEILEMSLGLRPKSAVYPEMLTEAGKDIPLTEPPKYICFSGGVADYIYGEQNGGDVFRYGDIGILLGQAIRRSAVLGGISRFTPIETIRATVVGAGSHITEISGSTIDYDMDILPLKNIPILKLLPDEEQSAAAMAQAIRAKLDWFRLEGETQMTAIAFTGKRSPGFKEVCDFADAILEGAKPLTDAKLPLVIVTEQDMAKVLGQTMRARSAIKHKHICIDAVRVDNGDYIDIGMPAAHNSVLPVVVKTLVFH